MASVAVVELVMAGMAALAAVVGGEMEALAVAVE